MSGSVKSGLKTRGEAKVLQNRTKYHLSGKRTSEGKLTQRLFSFDTCTYLEIYTSTDEAVNRLHKQIVWAPCDHDTVKVFSICVFKR